ncbi:TPA: DUF2235 domain-containing protein [Escherichia coli]
MWGMLDTGGGIRAQLAEDNKVGNCGREWHVGFFFDGVGRNIDQDASEQRLSNVARLFRAYPDEDFNTDFVCHNKFYFSGMGTPYNEELISKLYTIMDQSLESMKEDLNDFAKETHEEISKEIRNRRGSWNETLKKIQDKLLDPKELRKKRNDIFKNMAKKSIIESTQWIRDNEIISAFFLTGEVTRINAAKVLFANAFVENSTNKKDSTAIKIKSISVSLYGYDTGAALARKFLDELLEEFCEKEGEDKYLFKKVPVNIVFAGFFDCSRHSPASNNNGLDYFLSLPGKITKNNKLKTAGKIAKVAFGEKAIELDTILPGTVKNALHLVAAYERRLWRSLYQLGSSNTEHKEILLPGCSEDVGGGLKPDEQKPSAELCRVALQKMYEVAYDAGVPFPDFETLPSFSETVSRYFLMNEAVEGKSVKEWMKSYDMEVGQCQKETQSASESKVNDTDNKNDLPFDFYLDIYFKWLANQYYLYCTELYQLDEKLSLAHRKQISGYGPLAGTGINPNPEADEINAQIAELKSHWGWLDDVRRVATGLSNDFNYGRPMDTRMLNHEDIFRPAWKRAELFLDYYHKAWNGEELTDISWLGIDTIHSYFTHDLQTVDTGASINESFFLRRMAEYPKSKEKPEEKSEEQSPSPDLSGGD